LNTQTSDMEHVACPLCGSSATRGRRFSHPPFDVIRCGNCELWRLSPRLPEAKIQELYGDESYFEGSEGGYADYDTQEGSLRKTFRILLENMSRSGLCGGRLLEVGCGYGFFLDEARPYFAYREGTEFSRTGVDRSSAFADKVHLGGLAALPPAARYDCIVALQVIEHVYDPVPFVRRLRDHLADGGLLLLSTPNMGSLWRKLFGSRWPSFKIPEHVAFYDSTTLPRLFRGAGFEQPRAVTHPHAFPLEEVFGKLHLRFVGRFVPGWIVIPNTVIAFAARR